MNLPVLETSRLTLREIEEGDAEGLHAAYGNAEAMKFWDVSASSDVAQTGARIRASLGVHRNWHGTWAILTRSGEFVGAINYHDRDPRHRRLAAEYASSRRRHRGGKRCVSPARQHTRLHSRS